MNENGEGKGNADEDRKRKTEGKQRQQETEKGLEEEEETVCMHPGGTLFPGNLCKKSQRSRKIKCVKSVCLLL